jgi:hypothetical protein
MQFAEFVRSTNPECNEAGDGFDSAFLFDRQSWKHKSPTSRAYDWTSICLYVEFLRESIRVEALKDLNASVSYILLAAKSPVS